jgi:hypothetical protein
VLGTWSLTNSLLPRPAGDLAALHQPASHKYILGAMMVKKHEARWKRNLSAWSTRSREHAAIGSAS